MEWEGDLDDLPEGASQALADALLDWRANEGPPVRHEGGKIRYRPKIKFKDRPRNSKPGLEAFEPDLTRGNYNKNVTIEITVPAYLVMGMHEINGVDLDEAMRIAMREYLEVRGVWWWYPRFLIGGKYDVQAAKDRFTRRFG